MSRLTPVTAADVFEQILEYCKTRAAAGGYWGQGDYKREFFFIFYNAYANGRAGYAARSKYNTARKRKKRTRVCDWVVHSENIPTYLEQHWPQYRRHRPMVKDLCCWWDAWTYCLDFSPREIRRAYFRRNIEGTGPTD